MRIFRICAHSFFLAWANIVSVIFGFGIYSLVRPADQIAVQAPVAGFLSIVLFVLWCLVMRRYHYDGLFLRGGLELILVDLVSLAWGAIIFVPLHYLAKGYLSSFANILALWLFQLPVNFLAVLVVLKLKVFSRESV
jgi:hypothetical protein